MEILTNLIALIVSLSVLVFLGERLIDSSIRLAKTFGVSSTIIGLTVLAYGTSLPETVVSIIAAKRGEFGISAGNIAGSNIFNILWILGFASILNPLAINFAQIYIDLIFLILITLLFYIGLLKRRLTRGEGILYIAIYLGYIYYPI